MRGKGDPDPGLQKFSGITPAYAGKRTSPLHEPSMRRDHPRVCGEKLFVFAGVAAVPGSPPHVRGKGQGQGDGCDHQGITPAYAGKSRFPSSTAPYRRDHPRVCGEKYNYGMANKQAGGSPPRMRGKGKNRKTTLPHDRITPAYAGKSTVQIHNVRQVRDHPRVCGEKVPGAVSADFLLGSPPRMRGKANLYWSFALPTRITPAYAGKRYVRQL